MITFVTMNYLAHILLSGTSRRKQIGNFIGDFVKGKQYENYPPKIREGILLHRKIDHYTDNHPKVRETIEILRPDFGRYSAIVTDMYFDYFLALHFRCFSKKSLKKVSFLFYLSVIIYYRHLPGRVKGFIFHFIFTNRLTKYNSLEGLYESFSIMSRHKTPAIDPKRAMQSLEANKVEIEKLFLEFFPDLIRYVSTINPS